MERSIALDIRIGNQLLLNDRVVIVASIEKDPMEIHYNIKYYDISNKGELGVEKDSMFKGVPLSEEWLLDHGFHKDGEYISMGVMDYKYCLRYREWANNWGLYQEYTDSPNPKDNGIKYPISFDYVMGHQIQNIFFDLMHQELKPLE